MRLRWLVIGLFVAACGGETELTDAGSEAGSDAGRDAEVLLDARVLPDAQVDPLALEVDRMAGALVDASGEDPTRAVGLTVVVVSDGLSRVFGYGALQIGGATTPDGTTCFPLGSVSKVFTGLLLASAIEQGALGPDDPVNTHLAADLRAPDAAGVPISLEHLASHHSGLANFPDNMTGPRFSPAGDYSRSQLATYLAGSALEATPGNAYAYSNLGSGLLGIALADSAGDSDYDTLLRRELTGPLAMLDTGTHEPAFMSRIASQLVQPYRDAGGSLAPVDVADMGVLAGGGEVLSTGDDMLAFLRVLTGLDAHPVAGAVERTITVVGAGAGGTDIAYALDVTTLPDGSMRYEKAGVTAGSTTYISFLREPAVGVAVLSNRGGHMAIRDVARALVAQLADR